MSSYDSEININTIKKYFPYSDKKINYNRVLKKWKVSFREIYPNINIQKKINNLKLPRSYVGVHIRATEINWFHYLLNYLNFRQRQLL